MRSWRLATTTISETRSFHGPGERGKVKENVKRLPVSARRYQDDVDARRTDDVVFKS
jgi:hypothetical protein